jgi:hypothetical protein
MPVTLSRPLAGAGVWVWVTLREGLREGVEMEEEVVRAREETVRDRAGVFMLLFGVLRLRLEVVRLLLLLLGLLKETGEWVVTTGESFSFSLSLSSPSCHCRCKMTDFVAHCVTLLASPSLALKERQQTVI